MSVFTKDAAPRTPLEPLTRDRVAASLQAKEWSSFVDSDGDLGGFWENNVFYFLIAGQKKEILQVRGVWRERLPAAERPRVLDLVSDWNTRKLWPKAVVQEVDDELVVRGEVTVDYEHGLTDEQLAQHVRCAISTTLDLFRHLGEHYAHVAVEPEPDAN